MLSDKSVVYAILIFLFFLIQIFYYSFLKILQFKSPYHLI